MIGWLLLGLCALVGVAMSWLLVQVAGRAIERRLTDPAWRGQTWRQPQQGSYDESKALAGKRESERRVRLKRRIEAGGSRTGQVVEIDRRAR